MANINQVTRDVSKLLHNTEGTSTKSPVEFCQVEKVNNDNYTVQAYFFTSGVSKDGVPFCFPYQNLDKGILFMPEVGSIGVAVWGFRNQPVILSFVSPPVLDNNNLPNSRNASFGDFELEYLYEGELLLQSSGRSFVKLDRIGNATIGTPRNTYIKVEDLGSAIYLNSEELTTNTESGVEFRGFVLDGNGLRVQDGTDGKYYTYSSQKTYRSADQTVNVATSTPSVAVEVVQGNVFTVNTDKTVTLKQRATGANQPMIPIRYELATYNSAGVRNLAIDIDASGNVFLGSNTSPSGVARIGDNIEVIISGVTYTGTITTGSGTVFA